jgi:hypothetical protein
MAEIFRSLTPDALNTDLEGPRFADQIRAYDVVGVRARPSRPR